MTENQFWWANLHNHDHPEVVEVTFEDGKPRLVHVTGTDIGITASAFELCQVRLIERVLPPGRVTAAVLSEVLDASSQNGDGYVGRLQAHEETDDDCEPTGRAFTLVDGYFDLEKAAAVIRDGEAVS